MPRAPAISFVLVHPQSPGNVGAVARALKNCAFRDLRIVGGPALDGEARKMAWKSLDVLGKARRFESLAPAIADARLVVGFTARSRRDLREHVELDVAVPRILEAAAASGRRGRVALLFGREDRGLTADELAPCTWLTRIPAAKTRAVYNLSQAVLLAAFALRRAIEGDTGPSATTRAGATTITAAQRRHLLDRVTELLVSLDYREHRDPGLLARIVERAGSLVDRARLDAADAAMLLGVIERTMRRLARD